VPPDDTRAPSLTLRQVGVARLLLAVLVAGLAAAFGALLLGEYPFSGATPWVAGVLFGYVVAEIVVSVGRRRGILLGLLAAVFAAAALLWAGWISAGDGKQPYPAMAWAAAAVAVVVALLRAGPPIGKRARRPREVVPPA
jgi:membrane associated rhomboid family serine protease